MGTHERLHKGIYLITLKREAYLSKKWQWAHISPKISIVHELGIVRLLPSQEDVYAFSQQHHFVCIQELWWIMPWEENRVLDWLSKNSRQLSDLIVLTEAPNWVLIRIRNAEMYVTTSLLNLNRKTQVILEKSSTAVRKNLWPL